MIYYQRPAQYYAAPQRMMYVRYMHPSPFARSTQGAEALVAGQSVATGTYLKGELWIWKIFFCLFVYWSYVFCLLFIDCDHAEADITAAGPAVAFEAPSVAAEHGEDVLSEATAGQTEFEAAGDAVPVYTAEVPADVDIVAEENEVSDDAAKVPREFNLDAADNTNVAQEEEQVPEAPVADVEAPVETPVEVPVEAPVEAPELPAPAPIAPVAKPVNRYLPAKKKVYVELDQSVESDEETGLAAAASVEEEEEDEPVAPVVPVRRPARRPAAKKPAKATPAKKEEKPLPVGTFFPINFGGTKGGAIAIANSFSTGEGGSATSHAIAYGSPDAASLRGCVSCKKH